MGRPQTICRAICVTSAACVTLAVAIRALDVLATPVGPATAVIQDAQEIIQNSVVATHKNWAIAAQFDRCERDTTDAGAKTYAVTMILGSPYYRLTAIDEKPVSDDDRQRADHDEDAARAARASEAQDERARRVTKYERQLQRNRLLLEQLPYAFDFTSEGTEVRDGFDAYVIRAIPKRDYRPADSQAEVLKGMEGRLWIEQHSFQWIKVEANVVHSVSIEGFLATVQPGTQFSLSQQPVDSEVWLPTHFSMRTRARIFFLFRHRSDEDETYFDYRRIDSTRSPDDARGDRAACLPASFN